MLNINYMTVQQRIKGMIVGGFVGDAVGVPYEFQSREEIAETPCVGMKGFGTYKQPIGTWSDDSSMLYCIAESVLEGYERRKLMDKFLAWYRDNKYTATGVRFDIGLTTQIALQRYTQGRPLDMCGKSERSSNGNGSLMRTAGALFLLKGKSLTERYEIVREISALTHSHAYSCLGSFFFTEMLYKITEGLSPMDAYKAACNVLPVVAQLTDVDPTDLENTFGRIFDGVVQLERDDINSSGYVVSSLEAAIWCFFKTTNYRDCILMAVNLGSDTDTTAAIAGNLAGLVYGIDNIPSEWINVLQKKEDVQRLATNYAKLF